MHASAQPCLPLPVDRPGLPDHAASGIAASTDRAHASATTEARCVVCEQLQDTDEQYFGRLLRNHRARGTLAQTLATSMGFCREHAMSTAALRGPAADTVRASMHDAGRHLCSLLDRSGLQDELVQDILFGARGRCPACTYFHRGEGRVLARVQRALEERKPFSPPPMCFVHMQLLLHRIEPRLRGRMKRSMRARSLSAIAALDRPHACCTERATEAYRYLYPLESGRHPPLPTSPCACPVCEAVTTAQNHWLATAIDNVRLAQPGWIALPTCHRHLLLCLRHPDPDFHRAAFARYLEVALPGPSSVEPAASPRPKRRRRKMTRWFDRHAAGSRENSDAQHGEVPPHDLCPGCAAEEIAARKGVARLIRGISRAGSDDAAACMAASVCLKHFAEAFIYASAPDIERRLHHALTDILRRDRDTSRHQLHERQ
ncbi:hypothetical protein ACVBGC_25920 [Burkholderia stagnalis]